MAAQRGSIGHTWRSRDALALRHHWDRARRGEPLTVVVRGDAGAGKTRLVRSLVDRAEADGAVVVRGAAVDVGEQLPCWPVASGMRRLLGAQTATPGRPALEPWRHDLAPLLEPGGAEALPSSGHLLELVRRVLVGVSETAPVLLVVDDLHWADRTTRELVLSLVAHLSHEPIMVVVTVRSDAVDDQHPLRRMLPELTRDHRVRSLELAPLPLDVVTAIVAAGPDGGATPDGVAPDGVAPDAAAGQDDGSQDDGSQDDGVPAHLVDLVWRRSRGNAFIVAETLAAVAEGAADGLSPGLRGLVLGRVAGLGPAARAVVQALALGEEPVPHALLAGVLRVSERDLVPVLREAADAAVVVVDSQVEGYALRHGLMRDVVAGELMPGERRVLHRRYALALDAVLDEAEDVDHPDPAVTLSRAHHWVRADDPDRALPAVVHAAHVAEQMHEFGTAHRQWMAAVELSSARSTPDRAALAGRPAGRALPASSSGALLTRAADTARLAGEYDAAIDLLLRLVPDPAAAQPADLPTVVRLGRSLLDAGRTGDAVEVLRTAGASSSAGETDRAALHAAHAEALLVAGDVAGARREAERALALSRTGGEQAEQAPMLATLGFALAYLENPDAGLAAVAEGLMIAERTAEPAAVGRAYQAWADLLSGPLGENHEGVEVARQGVARMRDLGLARSAGVRLLATAANGLFRLGRWSEATDAVEEAWALRPTGADELAVRLARCRLQVGRGEFDGADDDIRAVDLLALDGTGASRYRVPLLTLRSGIAMWRGHPEQARELVAAGLDVAEHTPDDVFLVAPLVWHGLRAEAEAVGRGRPAARSALHRLEGHVAHLEERVPHTVPALRRTVLAYVRMCRAEGRRVAGRSDPNAWAHVAETWSALLNPYPAAYALLRRAEALLDGGASRGDATRALRAAAETATAMGAGPFLDEIAALARRARLDIGTPTTLVTTPGGDPGPSRAVRSAPELAALTEREYEVLAVLAEGLSNRQIAHRLFISERTVAVHVSRVLTKTNTRSRTQAAAVLQRVRARPVPPVDRPRPVPPVHRTRGHRA